MQFIKTTDWAPGIASLSERLERHLKNGMPVLWLVPGGSNIAASVQIMAGLPENYTQHLSILLTDERYGPVGHADSNQSQLLAAGFEHKRATILPVLVPELSLEETRHHYETLARQAFSDAEVIIGQFGIGGDGHIAGILPNSAAVDSPDFVAGYAAGPYERLTLTSHALKRLTAAYAFVFGEDKREALERLFAQTLPYADQPSQILKELPEAYVFNDQIGEAV